MIVSKIKPSAIHLLISAIIVFTFLAFALLVWYPAPFLEISGLKQIIIILISVDLVLGPVLTFIVYKANKPSLSFDLGCIALVQIVALAYGMYTIHQGHPVYVAYAVDRFTLISAKEAQPRQAKYPEHQVSTLGKPLMVYAQMPSDPETKDKLLFEVLSGKPDIDARPEFYEPIEQHIQSIMSKSLSSDALSQHGTNQNLATFLEKHGQTVSDYAFIPLVGKAKDVIWAWNRRSGRPVDIIDINPWKRSAR